MSDAVVFIDGSMCRICYEEEELERCQRLECPCACSGTLKFAHRDCIQRWCEEKGNTTCEICLEKFKDGYSPPAKKPSLVPTIATVSLDVVARNEADAEEVLDNDCTGCSSSLDVGAACCRLLLALVFTILLLIRNLFYEGEKGYPFSTITVVVVKATGIVVPMYALIRITAVIHNSLKYHQHYHHNLDSDIRRSSNESSEDYDTDANDNNA